MVVDIRFKEESPRQFQGVRMTSIYPNKDGNVVPEMIIHFQEITKSATYINLSRIDSITITND